MILEMIHKMKKIHKKIYRRYFTIENPETYILPDYFFVKKMYIKKLGETPHLIQPNKYCEKVNWLKLFWRKKEYSLMVDKYMVKDYVSKKIGEQYVVPLIAVWDNADDINFSMLPEKFVLKCNHNSDVTICTNKDTLDEEDIRIKLNSQLKQDFYKRKREWPYKNVPRKIICEQYMENLDGEEQLEYKCFCFNGIPKMIRVQSGRFTDQELCLDMYDMEWNYMSVQCGDYPMAGDVFEKPKCFDELCDLATKLSEGLPFVRVDFNLWNGRLYFGELTFFDGGGFLPFKPEKWNSIIGEWIELP